MRICSLTRNKNGEENTPTLYPAAEYMLSSVATHEPLPLVPDTITMGQENLTTFNLLATDEILSRPKSLSLL
jgi:hypothetical protein